MTDLKLIERIGKAFAHRPMPAEVVKMDGRFQIDSDIEDALWFAGRDWRDLNAENWRCHYSGLSYFSPEAFAYYVQSLLILTIQNPKHYPDLAVDSLVWELDSSPGIENLSPLATRRYYGFSDEEFEAIKEWLLWASENVSDVFSGAAVSGPGDGFGRAFDSIHLLQKVSKSHGINEREDSDAR